MSNKILAVDLGKYKSVACIYQVSGEDYEFATIQSTPKAFHDLIVRYEPDRVVIEVCSQAGWVCDLVEGFEIEMQVANTNHDSWRWKNTKRKTDRDDALKLARLSAMNQLFLVHLPNSRVRQWRSLIGYRHTLVARRTAIKNSIRAILDREGLSMPVGKHGWTNKSRSNLVCLARPMDKVGPDNLWRGQLYIELQALKDNEVLIRQVEEKLEKLSAANKRVQLLRTIPGVGPRLAEVVVAMIDDPKRFKNGKQVGAYAGLVPKQYESGTMHRQGRITGRGNKLLRGLLVEVSWLMRRYNGHLREIFERICRGSKSRRKVAVVAVARRLLVCCWAMLRDETRWRDPTESPAAAVTV